VWVVSSIRLTEPKMRLKKFDTFATVWIHAVVAYVISVNGFGVQPVSGGFVTVFVIALKTVNAADVARVHALN
jgi:hypothetical protein